MHAPAPLGGPVLPPLSALPLPLPFAHAHAQVAPVTGPLAQQQQQAFLPGSPPAPSYARALPASLSVNLASQQPPPPAHSQVDLVDRPKAAAHERDERAGGQRQQHSYQGQVSEQHAPPQQQQQSYQGQVSEYQGQVSEQQAQQRLHDPPLPAEASLHESGDARVQHDDVWSEEADAPGGGRSDVVVGGEGGGTQEGEEEGGSVIHSQQAALRQDPEDASPAHSQGLSHHVSNQPGSAAQLHDSSAYQRRRYHNAGGWVPGGHAWCSRDVMCVRACVCM